MFRAFASVIVLFGIGAIVGCSNEPGPTEKGGGFQLPPDAKKAMDESAKPGQTIAPDMMDQMKKKPSAAKKP